MAILFDFWYKINVIWMTLMLIIIISSLCFSLVLSLPPYPVDMEDGIPLNMAIHTARSAGCNRILEAISIFSVDVMKWDPIWYDRQRQGLGWDINGCRETGVNLWRPDPWRSRQRSGRPKVCGNRSRWCRNRRRCRRTEAWRSCSQRRKPCRGCADRCRRTWRTLASGPTGALPWWPSWNAAGGSAGPCPSPAAASRSIADARRVPGGRRCSRTCTKQHQHQHQHQHQQQQQQYQNQNQQIATSEDIDSILISTLARILYRDRSLLGILLEKESWLKILIRDRFSEKHSDTIVAIIPMNSIPGAKENG